MDILLYQQQIDDTKHNLKWKKDKVSYRHKNFDAVIETKFKETIKSAITAGLDYPLLLTLEDKDYFVKMKKFTRKDGTEGQKPVIVIRNAQEITQGEFENKSLDEVCDELEERSALEVVSDETNG